MIFLSCLLVSSFMEYDVMCILFPLELKVMIKQDMLWDVKSLPYESAASFGFSFTSTLCLSCLTLKHQISRGENTELNVAQL